MKCRLHPEGSDIEIRYPYSTGVPPCSSDWHSGQMKEQLHLPQSFTCAPECCWWQFNSHLQFCLLSDYWWELTARALGSDTLTGHYSWWQCNFRPEHFLCVAQIAFIFREIERVVSVLSELKLWGSLSEKTFIYWYFSHSVKFTGFPHLLTNNFIITGQGSFKIIVYVLSIDIT